MPWPRPTLTELRQLGRSFFDARLPGADAALRRSNIGVLSDMNAGLANGTYGYQDYLIRQAFTDTAEGEYLLRIGARYGLYPKAAVKAAGQVTVTGTEGDIPNQFVLFQNRDGSVQLVTQAEVALVGGTADVPVLALTGGADANLATGTQLTLIQALAGVNPQASVTAPGLSGGLDEEDIEDFRARVLERQAAPPQGGIATDYVAWAKNVPGVTRVWVYPANRGGGTCDLTFVMDGRNSIIPLADDIAAVQAEIDKRRPVTDDCLVFAPIATAVNFAITGPFTADQQAAVIASVKDMFRADAVPGGAYDPIADATLSGGLSFEAQIDPAVAAGAGEVIFDITAPVADIAGVAGHILVPGNFVFS